MGTAPNREYPETRKLPVELTEAEMAKLAIDAGHIQAELTPLRVEQSQVRSAIAEKLAQIKRLLEAAEQGHEMRDVPCTWKVSFRNKSAKLTRDDTGEQIDERPLTPEELQLEIFNPPEQEPPPPSDDDAFGETALDEEDDSPRYRAGDIPPKDKSDGTPDNLVNLKDVAKKKGAKKKSGGKGKKK